MGFGVILVGFFLFLFLVVVALLINPPNAWVQKFTDKKDKLH
jgi:hypothetical protein